MAEIATKRLSRKDKIDNMLFGTAMVDRAASCPRTSSATAEMGVKMSIGKVRRKPRLRRRRHGAERALLRRLLAAAGQGGLHATARVARDLGFPLAEQAGAGCCGHGSRGTRPAKVRERRAVFTVCPACDYGLQEVEIETEPVWQALVEHAGRHGSAS